MHTYTHPYMSEIRSWSKLALALNFFHSAIQNNTRVVAELGYTMQIIYDSTGGRVPKFWRYVFFPLICEHYLNPDLADLPMEVSLLTKPYWVSVFISRPCSRR